MNSIEIQNLRFAYPGSGAVLKGLNMAVPEGSICGFLGKNGAGKTTALKLVLGLLKNQEGDIKVLGKSLASARIEILSQTGTLIESPSFYAHLSARENLNVLRRIYDVAPSRVDEVLAFVGLENTGKKKVRQFSLGMKQRLSIGMALLHNPRLLILDEPTNGLDPNGIIEMRDLLTKLNKEQGITILLSSHLLSEIEKIITHLIILNNGTVAFQGSFEELKSRQSSQRTVVIETDDISRTIAIIQEMGIKVINSDDKHVRLEFQEKEQMAAINNKLLGSGISIYQAAIQQDDLESIFIELTK